MSELFTMFQLLREAGACVPRYRHLARALGGVRAYGENTPITISTILDVNGFEDALWALRATPAAQAAQRDRMARLFACWCVRRTPLPDGRVVWALLTDPRSRDVVEVAERYAAGLATESQLAAAGAAAGDAADAAWASASDAARDAARDAACDAAGAAWAAARDAAGAAWAAARDAAGAAWDAASDAWDTARAAASAAASAAARDARAAQTAEFARMLAEADE